jgi:hypothetical protein
MVGGYHALDVLGALPLECIVERGGGRVDGSDGRWLAGMGARDAGREGTCEN